MAVTLSLCLFLPLLSGCIEQPGPQLAADVGADNIPAPDFSARGPSAKTGGYGTVTDTGRAEAQIFKGAEPMAMASTGAPPSSRVRYADASDSFVASGSGYQLNFDNADVGAISKAILGDILKANYLIDKRVSGQVTLTSSQPVPKGRLISLLESSLASVGASVVKEQDLYRIVPSADPGGMAAIDAQSSGQGYGTSVVTAHYMPAANLGRLLEGFGSRAGSIRTDGPTNLVIIQGTEAERRAAIEAANTVDVDWLKSKSVAILPIANSAPETVIGEVNRILDSGEGGMAQGAIQLQPMSRMNAVLAVARRPEGIELVRKWVARLDRADAAAGGVKVYRLQYAQAKTVAAALNDLFGGGGSSDPGGRDAVEPSVSAASQTASPALGAGGQGPGGGSAIGGVSNGEVTGGGGQSPFGMLKTAMTSESAKAKGQMGETEGLHAGNGGGGKIRVTADPGSNSLLVNASPSDYRLVERAIRQMDRQPVQVAIEATIAEVTLTDQLQYGVQFFLQGNKSLGLSGATSVPATSYTTAGLNLLAGGLSSPRVLLNALQGYTTVKILSSPSLVVLDRQPAVLQVGDQVPVLTRTAQSVDTSLSPVVNSVDYKDTGIILNVLPKVNANGVVTLDVEQQISAVSSTDSTSLTPTISQRRVRSSVAVANGQTVMLAGLISDTRSNDRSGFPGLVNVQFLNDILSTHDSALHRTEIIIFIRPKIINTAADAQDVTEEFHDRLLSMKRSPERPLVRRY